MRNLENIGHTRNILLLHREITVGICQKPPEMKLLR